MSSTLKVDILQDSGGNNLVTSNGSGVITAAGFGKIGQVKQTVKDDSFTTTSGTPVDITGLNVSITPSSTSSKILVSVHIGTHDLTAAATYGYILKRGTTSIGVGTGDGTASTMAGTQNADRGEGQSMMFLDSPASASSQTYKLQAYVNSATLSINDRQGNADYSTISTITVQEVLP